MSKEKYKLLLYTVGLYIVNIFQVSSKRIYGMREEAFSDWIQMAG